MIGYEEEVDTLLKKFIDMGLIEDFSGMRDFLTTFSTKIQNGQIMRESPAYWKKVSAKLSTPELIALIRAMSVAEGIASNFGGGSVTPGIWLFRQLVARTGEPNDELADWVMSHANSEYLPWGRYNWRARSVQEYKMRVQQQKEKKARETSVRLDAEEQARCAKRLAMARDATNNIWRAISRGDTKAVSALIDKGADLKSINGDRQSPLEYATMLGRTEISMILKECIENGK